MRSSVDICKSHNLHDLVIPLFKKSITEIFVDRIMQFFLLLTLIGIQSNNTISHNGKEINQTVDFHLYPYFLLDLSFNTIYI